jgi:uncharacterized SAM-binding protein YcdF (DUF218 family)
MRRFGSRNGRRGQDDLKADSFRLRQHCGAGVPPAPCRRDGCTTLWRAGSWRAGLALKVFLRLDLVARKPLGEGPLYEFIVALLQPYTFLALCIALALACAWRSTRPRGRALKAACLLTGVLLVLSTEAAGYLAIGSLEWAYRPSAHVPLPTDTIVVLSGGMSILDEAGKEVQLGTDTLKRCLYAARLYRRAGGCRMVLSGGKVDWTEPGPTFAAAMRDFLVEIGVRPDNLVLEDKSSSTHENAIYSKPLLEQTGSGRIFLVTEASHMYRSEKCFRAQGVDVTPAACDQHVGRFEFAPTTFLPSARGISQVVRASHEWLGLAWYRLRGRI